MTLRIKNWNELYENNRTREIKHLAFVLLPNKQDGDGYTELMDHSNAAAHYGAWCALLGVASRCGVRGTLLRDNGKDHDCDSLSRMTRIPKAVFLEAIPRFVKIGWIEGYENTAPSCGNPAPLPQVSASEQNGTEQNGTEQKQPLSDLPSDVDVFEKFDLFWKAYPRKENKGKARAAWKKYKCDKLIDCILQAVEKYKQTEQWTKDKGRYIPMPSTWLNGERWNDEPTANTSTNNWKHQDQNFTPPEKLLV